MATSSLRGRCRCPAFALAGRRSGDRVRVPPVDARDGRLFHDGRLFYDGCTREVERRELQAGKRPRVRRRTR